MLQYGPTRGYRPLVECIAAIMQKRGADTTPERLLVTTGSQQGLDLVARVLLDPDDVILVELPTYTGAITAFRNVQAAMVGVRQEADGISLDAPRRHVATPAARRPACPRALRRPELPESDRPADRPRKSAEHFSNGPTAGTS